MKAIRRVLCAVLIAAIVAGAAATWFPSDAEGAFGHVIGCLQVAAIGAKVFCRFGPWWCAGGLVGGCVVGVIAYELIWNE